MCLKVGFIHIKNIKNVTWRQLHELASVAAKNTNTLLANEKVLVEKLNEYENKLFVLSFLVLLFMMLILIQYTALTWNWNIEKSQ